MATIVQQVNLYQPTFRKQKVLFSADAVFKILAVFALGLTAVYGYGVWQELGLSKQHRQMLRQVQELEAHLNRLTTRAPGGGRNTALDQKLLKLYEREENARGIHEMLQKQLSVGGIPMSKFFSGLARHTLQGLWLNDILISEGGERVAVAGSVTQPDLVPGLLGRLAGETAFRGRTFEVLDLDRPKDELHLNFHLRTMAENGDGTDKE